MHMAHGSRVSPRWLPLLAWFLLCVGAGRLMSFVVHDPILAYGNNYDMVRLQACHQIWPDYPAGEELAKATPTAPLRDYVLDKFVDTPCFPSSESLFIALGIEAATLFPESDTGSRVSIKAIGYAKAILLIWLVFAIQWVFAIQRSVVGQLANALVVLLVLTDPAVTLYLSTFYSEFSAVFFTYLTLAGLAILGGSQRPLRDAGWLCAGLLGLALSKPQHFSMAIALGAVLAVYRVASRDRVTWIPLLLAVLIPLQLVAKGDWTPRNDRMVEANKLNMVAAAVTAAPVKARHYLLKQLALGEDCLLLENKNWYSPDVHERQICQELKAVSHSGLALRLVQHPRLFLSLLNAGLPKTREWVYSLYGQVEGRSGGDAMSYHWSLGKTFNRLPADLWRALGVTQLLCALMFIGYGLVTKSRHASAFLFMGILGGVSVGVFIIALLGDGFVDLAKHAHLSICTSVAFYLVLLAWAIARFSERHQPVQGTGGQA